MTSEQQPPRSQPGAGLFSGLATTVTAGPTAPGTAALSLRPDGGVGLGWGTPKVSGLYLQCGVSRLSCLPFPTTPLFAERWLSGLASRGRMGQVPSRGRHGRLCPGHPCLVVTWGDSNKCEPSLPTGVLKPTRVETLGLRQNRTGSRLAVFPACYWAFAVLYCSGLCTTCEGNWLHEILTLHSGSTKLSPLGLSFPLSAAWFYLLTSSRSLTSHLGNITVFKEGQRPEKRVHLPWVTATFSTDPSVLFPRIVPALSGCKCSVI